MSDGPGSLAAAVSFTGTRPERRWSARTLYNVGRTGLGRRGGPAWVARHGSVVRRFSPRERRRSARTRCNVRRTGLGGHVGRTWVARRGSVVRGFSPRTAMVRKDPVQREAGGIGSAYRMDLGCLPRQRRSRVLAPRTATVGNDPVQREAGGIGSVWRTRGNGGADWGQMAGSRAGHDGESRKWHWRCRLSWDAGAGRAGALGPLCRSGSAMCQATRNGSETGADKRSVPHGAAP